VLDSEKDYQSLLTLFEKLIDIVGDNKTHPLSSLMETLCLLIENYESKHYPKLDISGNEILQFLMEQNALTPSDLPEIGSIDEVSKIIKGQQELKSISFCVYIKNFSVFSCRCFLLILIN